MSRERISGEWLSDRVREVASVDVGAESDDVTLLRGLLSQWAIGFAAVREDVTSSTVAWPRRGLFQDEARSFLRAVEEGLAAVDAAGFVTMRGLRPRTPAGRYALFSRSGDGVAINLEYLIQVGAVAELVLDLGWAVSEVDFERGEFDALTVDADGRPLVAMEAKARVAGPDSLEKMIAAWLRMAANPDADLANNAGRKWREIVRLTQVRPLTVWLVADGARWCVRAERSTGGSVDLFSTADPTRESVLRKGQSGMPVYEPVSFDQSFHSPSTIAGTGRCSWHGRDSCDMAPVVSFKDMQGRRQSGCTRAVTELGARGEIDAATAARFT